MCDLNTHGSVLAVDPGEYRNELSSSLQDGEFRDWHKDCYPLKEGVAACRWLLLREVMCSELCLGLSAGLSHPSTLII
jgi:hypothetical protein